MQSIIEFLRKLAGYRPSRIFLGPTACAAHRMAFRRAQASRRLPCRLLPSRQRPEGLRSSAVPGQAAGGKVKFQDRKLLRSARIIRHLLIIFTGSLTGSARLFLRPERDATPALAVSGVRVLLKSELGESARPGREGRRQSECS